jgi:hypothetical protein
MFHSVFKCFLIPIRCDNISERIDVNDVLLRILIEEVTACFKFPQNFPLKINGTLEEPLIFLPSGHSENGAGITATEM